MEVVNPQRPVAGLYQFIGIAVDEEGYEEDELEEGNEPEGGPGDIIEAVDLVLGGAAVEGDEGEYWEQEGDHGGPELEAVTLAHKDEG